MLTSAAISNDQVERKLFELLYEFYRLYFTGLPVTVGGQARTFPLLPKNTEELTPWLFGNSQLIGHPDAWVHTIISDWRPDEYEDTTTQKLVVGKVVLAITVRAANPLKGFQTADFSSRFIADGLRQIFECEQIALAQKDLHHVKVRRGPVPVSFPGAQSHMLMVIAQPMYRTAY